MNKLFNFFLLISFSILFFSCKKDSNDDENNDGLPKTKITVSFEYGEDLEPTAWKNIYVIWIENQNKDFIQNLSICQKLLTTELTGTALPFWKLNVYPGSDNQEVNAVTGATKANTDFSITDSIKDITIKEFTLYFEIDRSYESNDWFTDQPALLYAATIDLNSSTTEYELQPVGWTPNEGTENIIANTPQGELQSEMRYITHHKDGSSFGTEDPKSSTRMVKKITVKIQ